MAWKEVRERPSGLIIGWIEETTEGRNYRNFPGQILGRYIKNIDVTTNFQGQHLTSGDTGTALIVEYYHKHGTHTSSDIQ